MRKNNKVDIVEVIFHAFEENCFLEENKKLVKVAKDLNMSFSDKQRDMFLNYQIEMDYQIFMEERFLIKFVLDFLKAMKN